MGSRAAAPAGPISEFHRQCSARATRFPGPQNSSKSLMSHRNLQKGNFLTNPRLGEFPFLSEKVKEFFQKSQNLETQTRAPPLAEHIDLRKKSGRGS